MCVLFQLVLLNDPFSSKPAIQWLSASLLIAQYLTEKWGLERKGT